MTAIYHITHLDNLADIVARGALLAQSRHQGLTFTSIAHAGIQERRARWPVPCGPGGHLHDYVPFYFAPRSPMLYAILCGNVAACGGDQSEIVYLCSSVDAVNSARLGFVFTDGHAAMAVSGFYDNVNQLNRIDWPLMQSRYWNDIAEDPDRKRRRQAEFLVLHSLPLNLVSEISVMNRSTSERVSSTLLNCQIQIPINVRREWYF